MHRIENEKVLKTLDRMHQEASSQGLVLMKGISKGIFRKLRPEDMEEAYIAISRSQGELLVDLLVEQGAKHIVEFGTSFGISTLYLAAAAEKTGGKVITTELLASKCEVARKNFEDAGMEEIIELREGDALETLKDIEGDIDFLLLDGWNDLYLPLLKVLEPKFRKGTLIYTDNASFKSAQPFLEYLQAHPEMYKSQRLRDDKGGSELTEVIGVPEVSGVGEGQASAVVG